ncbi:TIGR01244 family sulfur transferase [Ostreiculturibacter nitratireducens]|uniref:TIGR01244 family sulfur transferase n=1 Tax=Ostreiculturibacter nitratireducens TaxID=3075226 RepID=UPI0031B62AED
MEIRSLTPDYAVAPQITAEDVPALKAAGFTRVICNRPDEEVTPDLQSAAIRAAVEAAGMEWVDNPISGSGMTPQNISAQRKALADAKGPVFAYCRSGTRSTIAWALSQAGLKPTEMLIAAAARGGYDLNPFRERIEALAKS